MIAMDSQRAFHLIESVDSAVLVTIRDDGRPRPVPIVFAVTADRRVLVAVDHKPKSTRRLRRLEDIERDERVAVLWQRYDVDWSDLWWVRGDGRATVADRPPAGAEGLVARYQQYQTRPPEGPWIEVTLDAVTGWEATPPSEPSA